MTDRTLAEDLPHRRIAWEMWDDMIDMLAYNPDIDSDVESLRDKIDAWQVRMSALLDVAEAADEFWVGANEVMTESHHDDIGDSYEALRAALLRLAALEDTRG